MKNYEQWLLNNPFQDYAVEMLVSIYKKYRQEKTIGRKISLDYLKRIFNYPIENALLNHFAVWGNGGNLEKKSKEKEYNFDGFPVTEKAKEKIIEFHNRQDKKETINHFIHWEHITPKSLIYDKIFDLMNGDYEEDGLKEELVKALKPNRIFIMAKDEARMFDYRFDNDNIKDEVEKLKRNLSEKDCEFIDNLKPYMRARADAVTRLYWFNLLYNKKLKIYFNGIDKDPVELNAQFASVNVSKTDDKIEEKERVFASELGIKLNEGEALYKYINS